MIYHFFPYLSSHSSHKRKRWAEEEEEVDVGSKIKYKHEIKREYEEKVNVGSENKSKQLEQMIMKKQN